MARKRITRRTAERLHRAAYEFEYLATSLQAEGYERAGYGVRRISSELGDIARALDRQFEEGA